MVDVDLVVIVDSCFGVESDCDGFVGGDGWGVDGECCVGGVGCGSDEEVGDSDIDVEGGE